MKYLFSIATKVLFLLGLASSSFVSHAQSKIVSNALIQTNDGTRTYIIANSLVIKPPALASVIFTANSGTSYVFKMANPDPQGLIPPSCDQNFVRTETILIPGITTESQIPPLSANQKTTNYEYVDGLGRNLQSVIVKATPSQQDAVVPFEYDANGRMLKDFNAYSANSANGSFKSNGVADQLSFFTNPLSGVSVDTRPFKENVFEASPLNRITDTYGPGIEWKNGTVSKGVKSLTKVNQASENITRWKYYLSGLPEKDGTYPDNHLLVQETTDEDGQMTKEYKDSRGLLVLKRVGNSANWFDTQYIYSPAGLLMIVIQPEGVARLATEFDAGGADKQSFLDRWCFLYQYDDEQRLIAKRTPGWQQGHWAYTVYDQWGRVVLTQTPSQSARNEWSFNKYDRFNRVILTGLWITPAVTPAELAILRSNVAAASVRFETEASTEIGYSYTTTFPTLVTLTNLLTISYYDYYTFLTYPNWETDIPVSSYNFQNIAGYESYNGNPEVSGIFHIVKGHPTGSKVRIGTNRWLNSVTWYDKKYRPIQVISENYVGGFERSTSLVDFTGKTLKSLLNHTSSFGSVAILNEFEFDHAGRLKKTYQTTDGGIRTLLAANTYNEIGQLIERNIHSTDEVNFLQSVDMRYNIRGWLSSINNSSLSNDGVYNNDANDLFGMELLYNPTIAPVVNGYTTPKLYNGNISAIKWKANTQQGLPEERIFGFEYDVLNRFKKSYYATNNGGVWTGNAGLFDEQITNYDKNGNIKGIVRNGKVNGASVPVDNLTHHYLLNGKESNRLVGVSDAGNTHGFKDAAAQLSEEFTYDRSGNLIYDHNKQISSITYNHLNLPTVIEFTRPTIPVTVDRIEYTYDATGVKLRTVVKVKGTQVWKTDYVGGLQYDNDQLSFAATPEGRVVKNTTGWDYEYFYKDHQGNVRLTYGYLKETLSYRATMENPPAPSTLGADENATFKNIATTRTQNAIFNFTKPSDQTLAPDKSSLTNGHSSVNKPIGPAKSLLLGAGDKVKMEVFARYSQTTGSTAIIAASALVTALATTTFGFNPGETGYTSFNTNAPAIPGIPGSGSATVPKAYLAYIFFNTSFQFVPASSGAISITSSAFNAFEKLERTFTAPQAGYLYVYVANESNTSTANVYFDEMLIVHQKATNTLQVTQASDYYPFGLTFNSYSRENSTPNQNLYNGKELQDELALNTYDFGWRQYDPAIARWSVVDPLAEKRYWMNPYNYVQNNPMNRFDPNGLTDYTLDKKTGEVKKVADTKDATDRIVKTRSDGSIKRKGEGFLGGLVRESKRGEAKTAVGGIEKGILKNGQNFRNKDEVISVGGEGQASVDGVKSFTLKLSEYIGKEIKGFSYSSDGSGNATDMLLGKYKDNTNTESSGTLGALQTKYGGNFSFGNVLQEFHTHPDGKLGATESSPGLSQDVKTLQNDKPFIPNASFIILYRIAGQEQPGEYDYTHQYTPKK